MDAVEINHKDAKKTQYKDYVSFLGSYKNGKKEEQGNYSLISSQNNSSSTINSDVSDSSRKGYREYLGSYNAKKYGPVQPNLNISGDVEPKEIKTVRTEVFIEINNLQGSVSNVSKVFEKPNESKITKVSKVFENDSATESGAKTVTSKVNQFESQITNRTDGHVQDEQRKTIGEITKKFENKSAKKTGKLRKQPSITEKSKVFEGESVGKRTVYIKKNTETVNNSNREVEVKRNIFNGASQNTKQKEELNASLPPKPTVPPPPAPTNLNNSPTPKTSPIPQQETQNQVPLPPPLPPKIIPVSPVPQPPPMPPNFSTKVTNGPLSPKPQVVRNGYNTLPKMQNHTQTKSDAVDGGPKLDKNDPRVKKLVYGALREMYGAYHDKANDYLATLPKHRVRKNNGLDNIIDSIAAQGGLDKLSGRANPNTEVE